MAEDCATTEEEFEVIFEYMLYQIRKHINDTIGEKHENSKKSHNARDRPNQLTKQSYWKKWKN
jgi:hypothetical protein